MRPLIVLGVLGLAGCATDPGSCDPAQAGFFSGISCEGSGAYTTRDSTLRSNLAGARANLANERIRAGNANIDANDAVAAQSRASSEPSAMRRQNASLRARLDTASRREGADVAAVNRQRAQLDRLERETVAAARPSADGCLG